MAGAAARPEGATVRHGMERGGNKESRGSTNEGRSGKWP